MKTRESAILTEAPVNSTNAHAATEQCISHFTCCHQRNSLIGTKFPILTVNTCHSHLPFPFHVQEHRGRSQSTSCPTQLCSCGLRRRRQRLYLALSLQSKTTPIRRDTRLKSNHQRPDTGLRTICCSFSIKIFLPPNPQPLLRTMNNNT